MNTAHYEGKPCRKCSSTIRYIKSDQCVSCHKKLVCKNHEENKDKYNTRKKELRKDPEYKARERRRKRTPEYREKVRGWRNNPYQRIKRNVVSRTSKAVRKICEDKSFSNTSSIGCGFEDLKEYLESQFIEGMSWDNYGEWEVDHIVPLSSAKTPEEIYPLCHYTNLQPLWKVDNRKKGSKL